MPGQPVICIVGGGAAGFFAAITCAEANPALKVVILERGQEVLQKVRISGGGRCNATHACFMPRELIKFYPRGEKELLGPFMRFSAADTVDWFQARGVALKTEADGRMFPVSDSSQTMIDCLYGAAVRAGVQIIKGARVDQIEVRRPDGQTKGAQVAPFLLKTSAGDFAAQKVMIAAGSAPAVWEMLKQTGHSIIPPVPSLFTFNIRDERLKELSGLSVPRAVVEIIGAGVRRKAEGPLLITHWGVSGPAVLKLSAFAARDLAAVQYRFQIKINWTAALDAGDRLLETKSGWAKKGIAGNALFDLPLRLWKRLVSAAQIADDLQWANLSSSQMQALTRELTGGIFNVEGKSAFKEEFTTAGGVELSEVNFKTFESKLVPGLYFAGEILNIDAVTGGFNFQAAWTGGWIAGLALADAIFKDAATK